MSFFLLKIQGHTKAISCVALNDLIEEVQPSASAQAQRRGSQSSSQPPRIATGGNMVSPRDKPITTTGVPTPSATATPTPRGISSNIGTSK
jgi:hypothetical protein